MRSVSSVQGNDAVIGRRLTAVHITEQEGISYHHSGRESVPNMFAPALFPLLLRVEGVDVTQAGDNVDVTVNNDWLKRDLAYGFAAPPQPGAMSRIVGLHITVRILTGTGVKHPITKLRRSGKEPIDPLNPLESTMCAIKRKEGVACNDIEGSLICWSYQDGSYMRWLDQRTLPSFRFRA